MSFNRGAFVVLLVILGGLISVVVYLILAQNVDNPNDRVKQFKNNPNKSMSEYFQARNDLINAELESSFGMDIKLTAKEEIVNKIIMTAKENELIIGLFEPHRFNPARPIFEALDDIKQSQLFKFIQKMPKGGLLHTHDMAICSADRMVSLTYLPNLWQRTVNNSNEIEEFRFSRKQPENFINDKHDGSTWRLVNTVRSEMGTNAYDAHIRPLFTLFGRKSNSSTQFGGGSNAWRGLKSINDIFGPIWNYAPARKAHYKYALQEMLDDGVQYMEFRSNFLRHPKLYDLNGTNYTEEDAAAIYIEALNEFKSENPSFIGSKCIFSGSKSAPDETIEDYFRIVRSLHAKFPHFIIGFDLYNSEDTSPRLATFAERILQLPDDLQLFLHTAETNWYGGADENLFDAVLLGSRRIGHAFALSKHPHLLELVESNDIALEVNPISNQVLGLVNDLRNHPASIYFARNLPVVISSDDHGIWETKPLSHDFYMAFLGVSSRHSDLRFIKKLAINSIRYSAMNETEQIDAMLKWHTEWDKFVDDFVKNESK